MVRALSGLLNMAHSIHCTRRIRCIRLPL